jgi:hypothetical protein
MQIEIETLEGHKIIVVLDEVGKCYPDDDVIYFNHVPCKLSSAQPYTKEE